MALKITVDNPVKIIFTLSPYGWYLDNLIRCKVLPSPTVLVSAWVPLAGSAGLAMAGGAGSTGRADAFLGRNEGRWADHGATET